MPEAIITNPNAEYAGSADFTTYLDNNGNLIQYGQTVHPLRANDTILKWDAVALVAAATTVPLSVEKLDVSDALKAVNLFVGVAQEAAVAGQIVPVCTGGVTLVNIGTTDPIEGSAAVIGAADGDLNALLIGAQDATIVANTVLGVFLDVENAADIAPVNIYPRM